MADDRVRRRRRTRRRKAVVVGLAAAVVAAGAGTAWAVSGSDGPSYRLSTVERADLSQTVDADGSLTSQDTATQSFATSGTVASVLVKTGEKVTAGQVLAMLEPSSLESAVTSARTTLANARQTLANDEAGQSSTATTTAYTSGTASPGTASVVLVSDTIVDSAVTKAEAAVKAAQRAVVRSQSTLDGAVADLTSACTTSGDTETTQQVVAGGSGAVTGTVDTAAVVTVADDSTTSDNPQTVASGGSWSFAGLTAGQTYRVVVVPVVDDSACTTAISAVSDAEGTKNNTSTGTLYGALNQLTTAITQLETAVAAGGSTSGGTGSGGGSGSGGSGSGGSGSGGTGSGGSGSGGSGSGTGSGTGSGSTGSGTGGRSSSGGTGSTTGKSSGSTSGSSSTGSGASSSGTSTTITAARIAADQKSIDAAKAALAVARHDTSLGTLTTPISGTVASVGITTGSSVSASSSSDTIVVTTDRALSVPVDISLADIGLIKVGEHATVMVDGRAEPLSAKVSMIGATNTSSSTGASSTYQVTLVLNRRYDKLFDGMGASVSIDVGTAQKAITVPVSAVRTTGTISTVSVYSGGKVSTTRVTLGVEGTSRVQVTDGLTVGEQVVLADINEALPSSDSDTSTRTFGGRSGSTGFGGRGSTGSFGGQGGGTGGPP